MLSYITSFGGASGKIRFLEESNGFVEVKELEKLGLTFVLSEKSGRAYLIFEKKSSSSPVMEMLR